MAQEFTCTSWIMSNININTYNFLTPVIYSYHSTSWFDLIWFGLVWRGHLPPFSSSGSLEPAPVVLFIPVSHMHLLCCSHYSLKPLSWFSVTLYQKFFCLRGCAIPLCMTADLLGCSIFPLFFSFCITFSKALGEGLPLCSASAVLGRVH